MTFVKRTGLTMSSEEFIEEVFEIAFGADAISRGFTYAQVLKTLRDFNDVYWGDDDDCN